MEYFKFIPEEITIDILSRVVPTESVLGCKSICKTWRGIICHPYFSKMHLQHLNHDDDSGILNFTVLADYYELYNLYYFDYNQKHDPTERIIQKININIPSLDGQKNIIGSCNGLICLVKNTYLHERIYVCNPITKEYVRLPDIKTDFHNNDVYCSTGFGYVSSTDEYKAVRIVFMDFEFVQVHIYILGRGNGWRNLGNFNLGGLRSNCIFLNGFLYWLYFDNDGNEKIVSFDLAEEKFCEDISLPPLPLSCCSYDIGILDGFLILAVGEVFHGSMGYDIWFLKNKNDIHDMKIQKKEHQFWSKEFRVENSELFAPTKTNIVLTYYRFFINTVNPKSSTSKRLMDLKEWIRQLSPHKNTLVSLKELGEEDTQMMERLKPSSTFEAAI